MKIFAVCALFLSLSCGLFADTNYDDGYYEELARCNSLPTNYQRQMCRLGLFARY